jgi:hypothetical protein
MADGILVGPVAAARRSRSNLDNLVGAHECHGVPAWIPAAAP